MTGRWSTLVRVGSIVVLLMLQACTEVLFKRGVQERDWAADRKACADTADYLACMQARGYFIRRMDGDDVAASTEFDPDVEAREADEPASAEPDDLTDLGVRIKESGPRGESLEPPRATPSEATRRRATSAAAKAKPADPLERYTVNSWWKFGGRPEEFEKVTAACVDRLGPEHAPEGMRYTRGSLVCIKESGWKAYIRR